MDAVSDNCGRCSMVLQLAPRSDVANMSHARVAPRWGFWNSLSVREPRPSAAFGLGFRVWPRWGPCGSPAGPKGRNSTAQAEGLGTRYGTK
jgi:hypothetical protein